ncbi:glycosyltransferase [Candidatus Woesearchaeota archaeon]|nr:glycosyltransferase [Candidatus Woesearchaeota archaeon]
MSLSVVIPVYNEADKIEANLRYLERFLKSIPHEIIISDDGSKDRTREIVESMHLRNLTYIRQKKNRGRGHAARVACDAPKYNNVLFMDADMPLNTDLNIIHTMLDLREEYDAILGSRYLAASKARRKPHRLILSRGYRRLMNIIFNNIPVSDVAIGFKMFSKESFSRLNKDTRENGWGWDLDLMLAGVKRGYKMTDVPLDWKEVGTSTINPLTDVFGHILHLSKLFIRYRR